MDHSREILNLAKQNNGIVTTAMVVSAGIPRGSLKYLADKGSLEWASRGVYILPEVWDDEFINLQSRYKCGIFALETALFLSNLTDRTGGFLIASMVGLDSRATMDLDATIKRYPVSKEKIREMIVKIDAIDLEDDIAFTNGSTL